MIKVGLLGAGTIAKVHAQAYAGITDVKVVVVGDLNLAQAEQLAGTLGAEATTDCTGLIVRPDLDAVDICLPTFLHSRYAVEAARAGKHVLCEKPMAMTLAEADAMIEVADRAQVVLMIAQVLRFWPQYATVKRIVDGGRIGKPLAVYAARLGTAPVWTWNKWILDPVRGGGVILDLNIHDLDFITWLCGFPNRVNACGVKSDRGVWEHIFTTLSYADGRTACAEASFMAPPKFPFTMNLRVLGENGAVEMCYRGGVNIETRDEVHSPITVYTKDGEISRPGVEACDAYDTEIRYFLGCVARGEQPQVVPACEARQSLAVALAAMRSAATGEGVSMI